MLRRIAFAVAVVGLFSCGAGQAGAQATPEQLDEVAKLSANQYDQIKEVFAEARAWLKDEANHKFTNAKLKRDDAKKLVEDLYAAGAVRFYASALMKNGTAETASTLMVVFGGQPAVRTKVLKTVNDFNKTQLTAQGKPELLESLTMPDAGQPILQVVLDY
ncbi:MAG: hypothetical protein K8U03_18430 [Planctomycetia bacterium]|nr:hypothetical protein [Planctomycetia bacterium]